MTQDSVLTIVPLCIDEAAQIAQESGVNDKYILINNLYL